MALAFFLRTDELFDFFIPPWKWQVPRSTFQEVDWIQIHFLEPPWFKPDGKCIIANNRWMKAVWAVRILGTFLVQEKAKLKRAIKDLWAVWKGSSSVHYLAQKMQLILLSSVITYFVQLQKKLQGIEKMETFGGGALKEIDNWKKNYACDVTFVKAFSRATL